MGQEPEMPDIISSGRRSLRVDAVGAQAARRRRPNIARQPPAFGRRFRAPNAARGCPHYPQVFTAIHRKEKEAKRKETTADDELISLPNNDQENGLLNKRHNND